jgi:AcrR family transcriptional regulator
MPRADAPNSTRDRLLLAAGQLLHESEDGRVSTRAICERAGVQAPTLYHHFGSKQGLLDAVINYGFSQYVQATGQEAGGDDPIGAVRNGWDRHVRFGLEHPSFYVLLYGQIQPGTPCTLTGAAEAMLLELLTVAARRGLLRVPPADAAAQIAAANVGVTLSLIAQPEDERDLVLSSRVRDAVLAAMVVAPAGPDPVSSGPSTPSSIASLAVALSAALDDGDAVLSASEVALLREWLGRLAR